jgi:DNA-binding CsgD family transcriptional regulator
MKKKICILLLLLLVFPGFFLRGKPVQNIKNFSKNEYHAANQNWSVAAGSGQYIYFANHAGLLEFDGTNWKLHQLPNQTILRSLKVVSDSLIYTGGYREIGFWKIDAEGNLNYHSLNSLAGTALAGNDEFWNISELNGTIYFHSFGKLLVFRDNAITRIETSGFVNAICRFHDNILIAIRDQGIFSLDQDLPVPFIRDPLLQNVHVRFLLPYKNNQLLIGTATDGIFLWNGEKLSEWKPEWSDYFRQNEVNRAHLSETGNLIIGTIIDGAKVFNANEELIATYNTANGLQNNTILGITTDEFGNTWLALDSGIGFVSDDSSQGIHIETIPGIGSIYDVAVFENNIYLGTNRGLFFKALNSSESTYRIIPEVSGQVWDCHIIDDQLFVGHNQGVLVVKNGEVNSISEQAGGFCLREDILKPGRLVKSTYSSMVIMEKDNGSYVQTGIINGFYDLIRYIEFDHIGNLWASHMHRGIYKLQLNNNRDSVTGVQYFGKQSVFGKDHSIHVFKVENRIVFTTAGKLFTYNDLNDSIVPYTFLNENLGDFARAHRIVPAPENHYWFITNEKTGLFRIQDSEIQLVKAIPNQVFVPFEMVDGFENILPLTSTSAIICLENGIARFDADQTNTSAEIEGFAPTLRAIIVSDNQGNTRSESTQKTILKIKFRYHNLQLQYAFPHYTHQPLYFQAFLKGIDQTWSEKTTNPVFNFDRLPAGEYELMVKAVDLWENESIQHKQFIEVLPPWYLTSYARTAYVFVFFLLVLGLQVWGIKRTRKKERRRLEKREQELIKLRNEKLRNEIEHKSKELANSTMSIIKKNEFLIKLKQTLFNQKEQLGTRYPDKYFFHITKKIDENISSQDDWYLFETNFERAHEQFLHKIKEQYPDLTPKDLRLCAFLRMNLSSKEIAPLLGISVRGVENHRYRLRKKMELEHDDNLIDMILKL